MRLTVVHDAELELSVHPALISRQREVLEGFGVVLVHTFPVHVHEPQATLTNRVSLQHTATDRVIRKLASV